jgi:membrane protein
MWEARRGRSWYRQWPFNFVVTLVAVVLATLVMCGVVLTGPVARAVGSQLGIGSVALEIWSVAKWPAIVVIVTLTISGLYYVAPNVRPPSWRWLTPGAALAVITWAVTSLGFGVYLANFNSYNKVYGTLGAIVTFLIWVWLTNTAILLGVELDSEIERERQLSVDQPRAADQIQLPLRQE